MAARYNALIEPLQVLIYIPTLIVFGLLRRGTRQDTSRLVLLLLAAEWSLLGVVFFLNIVAREHWSGILLGAVFIAGGMFYAVAAARSFPPHFHWRQDKPSYFSLLLTAAGALAYPGLGWLLGREYPYVLTYGMMPGPVALFTLAIAVSARPAPRLLLMFPPLLLALASPYSLWAWHTWEDLMLLPAAALALGSWLAWRKKMLEAPTKDTIRFDF